MLRSFVKYIMIAVTGAIVLCYGLGLLAGWVSPEKWALPTYFVMAMPIWILLMWFITIFWALFKKWGYMLVLCGVMVLTFGQWRKVITINKPFKSQQILTPSHDGALPLKQGENMRVNGQQSTIKILTFNTHIFNNHKDNSFEKVAEFIKESDADIVCLQEFGHFYRYGTSKQEILKFFDSIYPYRHLWFKNQHKWGENGLATFSRYPIIKKKKIEYKSADNISIYSDIVINNDTIRLINNHLESNKLNQEDREIAKKIMTEGNSRQEKIDAGLKVGSRLVSGAKNRVQQIDAVKNAKEETNHKIIVVGDFNDVPLSYTYNKICGDLQDAYAKGGSWGYHWTYNKSAMLFAIDHILVDKEFEVVSSKVHREMKVSDHYPMSCTIQLKVES